MKIKKRKRKNISKKNYAEKSIKNLKNYNKT